MVHVIICKMRVVACSVLLPPTYAGGIGKEVGTIRTEIIGTETSVIIETVGAEKEKIIGETEIGITTTTEIETETETLVIIETVGREKEINTEIIEIPTERKETHKEIGRKTCIEIDTKKIEKENITKREGIEEAERREKEGKREIKLKEEQKEE